MKAFLILEDGTVFCGSSIGSEREVISEIVFNTSMTGYLEVLTDPSYAGQAVVMEEGRALCQGPPEEIFNSGVLDRVFGVKVRRTGTEDGWQYYCV